MQTLTPKCPQCGRSLAAVPFMQSATDVVRRTCRKCHTRWHMVVRPARRGDVNITVIDFTAQ